MSTFINLRNGKVVFQVGINGKSGKFKPTSIKHIRRFLADKKDRRPYMFMSSCDFPKDEGFSRYFDARSVLTEVLQGFTADEVNASAEACGITCPKCKKKKNVSFKTVTDEDQAQLCYTCKKCGCKWVAVYEFMTVVNPDECMSK